jgi:hypothetical protein
VLLVWSAVRPEPPATAILTILLCGNVLRQMETTMNANYRADELYLLS